MRCPNCSAPIGAGAPTCPSCGATLLIKQKPTKPDEEEGWTLRLLAGIMGRGGSAVMIAQNAIVVIASLALAGQAGAFLGRTSSSVDIAPISILILVAGTMDLVGLGLVGVALIVLGAGSVFLRRGDPYTEEEVMVPPITAAFPMAAGLFLILWIFVTAVWRLVYPAQLGRSAAQVLTDFAVGGAETMPPIIGLMMGLWIVAAAALLAATISLRVFVRRLPSKVFSPLPMNPTAWFDFAVFNLAVTIGVAAFPLGWVGYDTTGGPGQIAFLTFLATKITILPLFGAFAYWQLFRRFDALGRLSLLVPVIKAIPRESAPSGAVIKGDELAHPNVPTAFAPPTDDDMSGIGHVK